MECNLPDISKHFSSFEVIDTIWDSDHNDNFALYIATRPEWYLHDDPVVIEDESGSLEEWPSRDAMVSEFWESAKRDRLEELDREARALESWRSFKRVTLR